MIYYGLKSKKRVPLALSNSTTEVTLFFFRLECIAFGYPVPYYNWTRINSEIPSDAIITNHNRVLQIPRVRVEDQGEYQCRAYNDKV